MSDGAECLTTTQCGKMIMHYHNDGALQTQHFPAAVKALDSLPVTLYVA